jgi:Cu/Ag efflux pump CusA
VVGGLITSTLLTWFVMPVFYALMDDLAVRVMGKKSVNVA